MTQPRSDPAGKHGGLTADAYHRIRAMILHQELRPGERTSVAQLVEATGLGRAPVKAAVDRLANERLLHVEGRRGTFVAKLDPFSANRIFEMRIIYETAAAPLIAERITDAQIESVVSLLPELGSEIVESAASRRLGVVRFIDADVEFHRRIIASADNPYLLAGYSSLNLNLLISQYLMLDGGLEAKAREREHAAIAEAIAARDVDAIVGTQRVHAEAVRDTILSTMSGLHPLSGGLNRS